MPTILRTIQEAGLRHALYYAGVLNESDDLYLKGGEFIKAGLELFDRNRQNIYGGQAWASEIGNEPGAIDLCNLYPSFGAAVLNVRQHARERVCWAKVALKAAVLTKDRSLEAEHLGHLGIAWWELGKVERAIKFHLKALAIHQSIGNQSGEAGDLGNLANCYAVLGDSHLAIKYYKRGLAIAREIQDRRAEAMSLGNLGSIYAVLGELKRSVNYYRRQLSIAERMGDRAIVGAALGNLGITYRQQGKIRRATKLFEQQLALSRNLGDAYAERLCLGQSRVGCLANGRSHTRCSIS